MNSKTQIKKDSTFFLDIFNQILKYNEQNVVIVFDKKGDIWFKLKDLLKMLGYVSTLDHFDKLKIDIKFLIEYKKISIPPFVAVLQLIHPKTKFINESGLYALLTKSNKPLAKLFLQKYLIEIMPEIRKTGRYIVSETEQNKINKLNEKLENYKTELNYYDDKYKFVPSPFGYIYINEDEQIKNGIKIKCYKIGFDTNMKERMSQYKVGNFKYKLLCYIPLQIDRKAIEQCVKSRLKTHLTKLTTDTICYTSLENLKKDIVECINFHKEHICNCVKCYKTYKLTSIDVHICNKVLINEFIDYKIPVKKLSKKSLRKSSKRISKKTTKKIYK
jgi:prophage antirepressor-like protein